MHELTLALGDEGPWKGRMNIIGSGVGGVSLADCAKAGRDAAIKVSKSYGTSVHHE
jgi:oxygen-dependent protoporphyrinogen oxidase